MVPFIPMSGNKLVSHEVQQLGPAVLLQGLALKDTRSLITRAVREIRRQDGIIAPPRLTILLEALERAISAEHPSPPGRTDTPDITDTPFLDEQLLIGSSEAANILGISSRQAQRLAITLGGKRSASRCWTYSRLEVEAYLQQRERELNEHTD